MKTKTYRLEKDSPWQRIFLQSKVNGAPYSGDELLSFNWSWPKNLKPGQPSHFISCLGILEADRARDDRLRSSCESWRTSWDLIKLRLDWSVVHPNPTEFEVT
jgi:hypothetical protein